MVKGKNNMNLLKETLELLKENNKSEKDVEWVGNTKEFVISWEEFKKIANVGYYNGFGASEIATDLILVGNDFWLTRGEYDGSEWWEYHEKPKKPKTQKSFSNVKGGMWETLDELNSKTKFGEDK